MHRALALLLLLTLAACGDQGLIRAGGRYSGVPDTQMGSPGRTYGNISTGGTISLDRERAPRL
jgi:hypothetical protein